MVGETGWRKAGWVALFLLPGLAGLFAFTILPILASLVLTFYEWDLLTPPEFVGMQNYVRLLGDQTFWAALVHTLTFIAGYVPLVVICALGLALVLNVPLRGIGAVRTVFFFPVVSSWVAVALLWSWLFNPRYGLINYAPQPGRDRRAGLAVRPSMGYARHHHYQRLEGSRVCARLVPGRAAGHPE